MHAGVDVWVEIDACTPCHIAPPKLETLDEGVASELCLSADEQQELTHLGLEDDDQGDDADVDDAAKYLGAEAHVEQVGDPPADDDAYYRPEDADDVGAFDQTVELVDQYGYQQDIEDVDKTDFG